MNLYEIKEKLKESGKAVFTINEIARILNKKKNVASIYVYRMLRKKLIYKIEKNKISITNDPFIVSSQLAYPSYISFISSLYLHGYISQVINNIFVATSKKRSNIKIFDTETNFIKLNPKMIFGYKRVEKGGSFIFLADLEKTIIDCLYLEKYCRLNYLINALKNADINKLEEYSKKANKEVINRRLGYLLDLIGRKHHFKKKSKTIYLLNSTIKKRGEFNNKWYLYINEKLED